MMDWLEEIALRDQSGHWRHPFGKEDRRLGNRPAPRPGRSAQANQRTAPPAAVSALGATEEAIHRRIQALKLHPEIRLTVPPGLEGGRLQVEFRRQSRRSCAAGRKTLRKRRRHALGGGNFGLLSGGQPTKNQSNYKSVSMNGFLPRRTDRRARFGVEPDLPKLAPDLAASSVSNCRGRRCCERIGDFRHWRSFSARPRRSFI